MISVSESAINQINSTIQNRGKGLGVRIGVKPSGCSGFIYTLEFADNVKLNDMVFDFSGAKVFIAEELRIYFKNLRIDYLKKGLNEGFEFVNEMEKSKCGCGKSFKI